MVHTKYIATPAVLLQALLKAKHLKKTKNTEPPPPSTTSASSEDVPSFTGEEGLVFES